MFSTVFLLCPPEFQAHVLEAERRLEQVRRELLLAEPIQKWSDSLKWAPRLHIDAKSYEPFVPKMFDVPAVDPRTSAHAIRHGDWGYQNTLLPKGEPLWTALGAKKGDVIFTDDVVIPKLWKHDPTSVWMSLTPMEMFSQRPGLTVARGHVLVGGLGMGWALRQIAKRKNVTHITVAEKCEDILDWFGRDLVHQIREETGKPITIHIGDAFEEANSDDFDRYDSFVFDVWKGYGAARRDYRWQKLKHKAERAKKRAWAWGASGAPGSE